MEISKIRNKIASRGHWVVILAPLDNQVSNNTHPRDKYKILSEQSVEYRGWPYPYFPDINNAQEWDEISTEDDINGCVDYEHHKECFTLFKSNQFVDIRGIPEDWVDESTFLQGGELKGYKDGEVLSFVSTTYFFTEVFLFIKNLINSDLYKDTNNFHFKFHCQKTKGRSLKIFGHERIDFSMDYKSTAANIKICEFIFTKDQFANNWEKMLIDCCIGFYKFFGTYEPSVKVIQSDIENLVNRRY